MMTHVFRRPSEERAKTLQYVTKSLADAKNWRHYPIPCDLCDKMVVRVCSPLPLFVYSEMSLPRLAEAMYAVGRMRDESHLRRLERMSKDEWLTYWICADCIRRITILYLVGAELLPNAKTEDPDVLDMVVQVEHAAERTDDDE